MFEKEIAEAGITADRVVKAINDQFGFDLLAVSGEGVEYTSFRFHDSKRSGHITDWIAKHSVQAASLATERQVSYIMSLIRGGAANRGGYMSGPTTFDGVKQLTKTQASAYIDSLTGRY